MDVCVWFWAIHVEGPRGQLLCLESCLNWVRIVSALGSWTGQEPASCVLCLLASCYSSISSVDESHRGQLAPCSIIIMGVFDHLSTG
jgi:hypothetical protein